MSTREVELADLEKKARKLEDEADSLVSSFISHRMSEEEYVLRRAGLEREFAKITARMTKLRFVKGRRSSSEKS